MTHREIHADGKCAHQPEHLNTRAFFTAKITPDMWQLKTLLIVDERG